MGNFEPAGLGLFVKHESLSLVDDGHVLHSTPTPPNGINLVQHKLVKGAYLAVSATTSESAKGRAISKEASVESSVVAEELNLNVRIRDNR